MGVFQWFSCQKMVWLSISITTKEDNRLSNLQLVSTDKEYYKLENDAIEEILNEEEYHKFENDVIKEIAIEI